MSRQLSLIATILALLTICMWSCRKDQFITDSSADLGFSKDTVLFDTVFTTIGSTTQVLKVYNPNNQWISISGIELSGGQDSQYRINVDGINGASHSNIEIAPNDSLWIFVEVTVDPGNIDLPFIVEDSIIFLTNGNRQSVVLNAWGQDAYFHGGDEFFTDLECDEVWNNDKPHVIYNIVGVGEGCCLTINAGAQVYCHSGSGIYVFRGCIDINGEYENEVVFQGDRLEPFYENLAGQWGIELTFDFETQFGIETATVSRGGIWLNQSIGSTIDYAIMKNGIVGLQVDTMGTMASPALVMRNTKINNMSAHGLWSQGGSIEANNCELTNCGQATAALTIGGEYDFRHCTFGNYWTESNRQAPSFILNDYYQDVNNNIQHRPLVNAEFFNCIMHGNNAALTDFSEFIVDVFEPETSNHFFQTCYVDSEENLSDDGLHFQDMTKSPDDPPFLDSFNGDFDFPAGVSNTFTTTNSHGISTDIKNQPRTSPFALGCHEEDQ